ncbi:hypothetical protein [Burkholderia stagnalis]|uniref:Uncharacterized protein n=1 Tax=Burkholderia stagnalis TaxID=1503054 RepID=A0ABX9YED9_9BURK|nr:hypothetical protein [Burkholderia stagnalis]RQQ47594.1 hypothetical protein DF158_33670 [Burkholderia stagnalis]RQQ59315.1 hypothetical protein DF137_33770 [Burkholderia stagnalis]RQQ59793.1 hypothetical protein DF139_33650 [Burkholderia stagnalis]RQQ74136.1 hypothetical protein DF138_33155 [Burkholderia stagnalis]RQQ79886.1 hypothetical protein DF134_33975 [Burkholderia stagnalis]
MFETIRREIKELVMLVRRTTEWDMAIAHGVVKLEDVSPAALAAHQAQTARIAALQEKYGV